MLSPADTRLLDDWGKALNDTFRKSVGIMHVGSSLTITDWRDIDVRIIMRDKDFARLKKSITVRRLNLMLTLWGQRVTGLPIDCQVQSMELANNKYPWPEHRRNPIGLRDSDGDEGA